MMPTDAQIIAAATLAASSNPHEVTSEQLTKKFADCLSIVMQTCKHFSGEQGAGWMDYMKKQSEEA
jgi:hypothetical protein